MFSAVECSLLEMWEDPFEVLLFAGSFLNHQHYHIYNTASANVIANGKSRDARISNTPDAIHNAHISERVSLFELSETRCIWKWKL